MTKIRRRKKKKIIKQLMKVNINNKLVNIKFKE